MTRFLTISRSFFFALFLVLCVAITQGSADAATFEWLAGNGFVDNPDNWGLISGSGTPPPDIGDIAEFNRSAVYDVLIQTGATPQNWDLDKILVTNGVVSIVGRHTLGNTIENTFLNLTTGDADIEVDGGHLILEELTSGSDDTFTVTVGDDFLIREGIAELQGNTTLNTPDMNLGRENSKTSEFIIDDGATLNVTQNFTNFIGLNAAQGFLTIFDGHATLAGATNLGVSSSALSSGVINISSINSVFADSTLTLDSLALGGSAGTGSLTASVFAEVGQTGSSTLTIGGSGGTGTVNVQDSAMFDTGTGNITINSTGTLNISGGTFQADGFLDFQGGTLNLSGGELFLNNGMEAITSPGGVFSFTGGTVRVEGGLARLETSLNYGGPSTSNRANLIVRDGNMAQVQFALRIGSGAGTFGRAEIVGVGSSIVGTGGGAGADLLVGQAGDGQLVVSDGGFASFRDDFVVGEQDGSNGIATIFGENGGNRSTVEVIIGGSNSLISVGPAGSGVLTVENGALARTGGDVFLASAATGDAVVTVRAGLSCGGSCSSFDATLEAGDDLWVAGGSTTAGGTAMLTVDDGGLVIVPDLMRVYAGGSVDLRGGRIEVGRLEFQGGSWDFAGFEGGTLHFTGSETLDASLVAGLSGTSGAHDDGLIEVADTLTITAPFVIAGGDLTAGNLNADAAITINDSVFNETSVVVSGTANITQQFTQNIDDVAIDNLALSATYQLNGGRLSIRTGSNLPANLNLQSGTLELTDTLLSVDAGGLLGNSIDVSSGSTIDNLNATTVANAAQLQTTSGTFISRGAMTVQNGGNVNNQSNLQLRGDLAVESGGTLTNVGTTTLRDQSGNTISGSIENQGTIALQNSSVDIPIAGLTLNGGGMVSVVSNSGIDGNSIGVLNNVDNRIAGNPTFRLELRDMQIIQGPTAEIGGGVDLVGVDFVGGAIDSIGTGLTILSDSTTIDGVVEMSGGIGVLGARVLPTGEIRLLPISQLSVSPSTFDLDGRLRAEAGANVTMIPAGIYDWSDGTVSLADDTSHEINEGATIILNTPLEFDTLTVNETSTGFVRAVFGAEPVIAAGQALQVAGTTTLDTFLTLDGGTFTTGFLTSYEKLDFRSGELHLTSDDFLVEPGVAGPTFVVPNGGTLTVDEQIETLAGDNRLIVTGGTVNGVVLINSGDLDVIDGEASFSGSATNSGDINAIDSTLSFNGGLNSTGEFNVINTTVNGSVTNSGNISLAGFNTFTGNVSGSGNYGGSGTAVFEGTLSPGESPAEVSFEGDVVLAATATLEIEIAGTIKGSQFDALTIGGLVSLDGALDVSLIDLGGGAYDPQDGDMFEIITATRGVTGTFTTIASELPALAGNLEWEITYGSNSVLLSVAAPGLPGDFNNNGVVDAADYAVWLAALGSSDETLINNNGDGGGVTLSDYNLWKSSFGNTSGDTAGLSSSAEVPEPTNLLLLFICIALSLGRSPRFSQP